ncbi:DUF4832 domain-containing protein [PVC group bacterium]|nr:DUF4832 domain-containing protein [PVC group bacterium]
MSVLTNTINLAALLILACATTSTGESAGPRLEWQELSLAPTDDVLLNPGMGLYMQHPPLDAEADEWFMQVADIAYYRLHWADVNPEEGVYTFDEYFGPMFDFWVKQHGKRVAFGVMSQSKHGRLKYVTPKWVFDRGVPGVQHRGIYEKEQINPVFWDDLYLYLQCEFIAKLGAYLDGREGFEFIDLRCIGEWGEMHLQRWTPEQLEATGFTHTKYVMAYRRMIDAFANAFPRSRVFLNVGGQKHHTINDYAALRGLHFRQDGLKPGGASYNCGEWLFKPYARRGVICNFECHSSYAGGLKKGWTPDKIIESGLDAPITYLNMNWFGGASVRRAPEEGRRLLTDAARRLGYRFVMTKLRHMPAVYVDGAYAARVPLLSTWRNDGVAPCYESFGVEWSLVDALGKTVASEVIFPETPTTQWWPGEEQQADAMLRVPADTREGRYELKVAMVIPETGRRIRLGIAGRDEQGRYTLCDLPAETRTAVDVTVYETSFETDAAGWSPHQGLTAALDEEVAHSGRRSLLLTGSQQKGWNYAVCYVPTPLMPVGKYRLTAWLRVEAIEPANTAPYVKIGVSGADGKWIENYVSGKYDLSELGTWQQLTVIADVPMNAASAHLAIEKGAYSTPITATMRLDDVKLELLEAP